MQEVKCLICGEMVIKTHRMQDLQTQMIYHLRKVHGYTIKQAKIESRKCDYTGHDTIETKQPETKQPETTQDIIINHNDKLNGIEIKFANKPSVMVINQLKEMGFRWSYKSMLWYNRYTVELWDKINALYGKIGVC